jgi:hypothetical protein
MQKLAIDCQLLRFILYVFIGGMTMPIPSRSEAIIRSLSAPKS